MAKREVKKIDGKVRGNAERGAEEAGWLNPHMKRRK